MRIGKHTFDDDGCPTEVAATLIGGKWKTVILTFLLENPDGLAN